MRMSPRRRVSPYCCHHFLTLNMRESFGYMTNDHFVSQWIPELKHYAPGVPIVLVGTKLGNNFL